MAEARECVNCGQPLTGDLPACTACLTPDYEAGCDVCGATPTLPAVGLCAPCTFGEHDATWDGGTP